jgi:dTDP-4-dehydrorhamnose reductase
MKFNFNIFKLITTYIFAKNIFENYAITFDLKSIQPLLFQLPQKLPAFSVLDKPKIKTVFGIDIKDCSKSLKRNRLQVYLVKPLSRINNQSIKFVIKG